MDEIREKGKVRRKGSWVVRWEGESVTALSGTTFILRTCHRPGPAIPRGVGLGDPREAVSLISLQMFYLYLSKHTWLENKMARNPIVSHFTNPSQRRMAERTSLDCSADFRWSRPAGSSVGWQRAGSALTFQSQSLSSLYPAVLFHVAGFFPVDSFTHGLLAGTS